MARRELEMVGSLSHPPGNQSWQMLSCPVRVPMESYEQTCACWFLCHTGTTLHIWFQTNVHDTSCGLFIAASQDAPETVQVPGRSLIALGGVMCIWHPSSATYTPLIPIRIRHVPSQRLTLLTMVHSVFEIYATYTY